MAAKKKILLIGAGGHCKVVLDHILRTKAYEPAGIVDLKDRVGGKVFGVPIIGTDDDLGRLFKKGLKHCFISIGGVGDTGLRVRLYSLVKKIGFELPNLISPYAVISPRASLGEGDYIALGAIVNADAAISDNCIINTGVIVEHGCRIGNSVHLSPGVVLSGGVTIGEHSHLGTGSVVIQNIRIGKRTIVGAGSVVTGNIRPGVVAYGNPCREIRANA